MENNQTTQQHPVSMGPTRLNGLFEAAHSAIAAPDISGLSGPASSFAKIATLTPEDLSGDDILLRAARVTVDGRSMPALNGIPLYRKLGQGGMAAVYYGVHPRLSQEVAIKVLPGFLAQRQPQLAQRFLREAQIAARVHSPNLVSVTDVNSENGILFIIMEFVSGSTASALTRDAFSKTQQGLSEAIALDTCIAATEGLAAAHASGIVHRDVKPDNIMVPAGPRYSSAKLADLGLAHFDDVESELTTDQSCMGTPGFIAPEQAIDSRKAAKPADVFSMGATLYWMLTAHTPFQGETPLNIILATIQQPHTPARTYRSDLSAQTLKVLDRCMAKEPELRFCDGAALLGALRACRASSDQASKTAIASAVRPAVADEPPATTPTPEKILPTIIASLATPQAAPAAEANTRVDVSHAPAHSSVDVVQDSAVAIENVLKIINSEGKSELPAVARFLSEVCTALHSEHSSGQKITDAIFKDIALTTRLLQTVNSAYYTTATAHEITTISRAVLVLGIDTISQVATCLSIDGNANGKTGSSPALKKMIVCTLVAGTYARELARGGLFIQPETAFIAGVMRQLSAVLIAQHLPEKHHAIEQLIKREHCDREHASRAVLGASYTAISRAIARSWKLHKIVGGICDFDTKQPVLRNNRAQKFSAAVSLSAELADATAIFDPKLRTEQLARVFGRYEAFVPVNAKRFEQLVNCAEKAMGQITSAMNITRGDLAAAELPAPVASSGQSAAQSAESVLSVGAESRKNLNQFLTRMDRTLVGNFDLEEVLRSIMEVMHNSCDLDHVILLLLTQQKDQLVSRLGCGPRTDDYLTNFKIPIQDSKGKLAEVVTGPREISSDAGNIGVSKELPPVAKNSTFILLPVVPKGKPIGALFCQRPVLNGAFTAIEKENLRQLRNRVTGAL